MIKYRYVIYIFIILAGLFLVQESSFAGSAVVEVSPPHADIYFQGAYVGTGSAVIGGLPSGTYYFSASAPGYSEGGTSVTVSETLDGYGFISLYELAPLPTEPPPPPPTSVPPTKPPSLPTQKPVYNPTPHKDTGSLYITSSPSGASVNIDGSYRGNTPLYISPVSTGYHSVGISYEGYENYYTDVYVSPGAEAGVSGVLTKIKDQKFGALEIKSTPEGATVYIDDKKAGKTPYKKEKISFGEHKVKLLKEGYKAVIEIVTIDTEKLRSISIKMEKPVGIIEIKGGPEGARVFLDSKEKGTLPLLLKDIPAGKHLLEIKEDGYETFSKEISVKENETFLLKDFKLNKIPDSKPTAKPATPVPTQAAEVKPTEKVETVPTEVIEKTPVPEEETDEKPKLLLLVLLVAIIIFLGTVTGIIIQSRKKKKTVKPEKIVFKKYKFKDIRPKSVGLSPGISEESLEGPLPKRVSEELSRIRKLETPVKSEDIQKDNKIGEETFQITDPAQPEGKRRRSFEDHIKDIARVKSFSDKVSKEDSGYLTNLDIDLSPPDLLSPVSQEREITSEVEEAPSFQEIDSYPAENDVKNEYEKDIDNKISQEPVTDKKQIARDMKKPELSKFLPLPERPRLDIKRPALAQNVRDMKRPAPSKFLPLPEPKEVKKMQREITSDISYETEENTRSFIPKSLDKEGMLFSKSSAMIRGKKPMEEDKEFLDITKPTADMDNIPPHPVFDKKPTADLDNVPPRPALDIKKPTSDLDNLSPRPALDIKKPVLEPEKSFPSRPALDIRKPSLNEVVSLSQITRDDSKKPGREAKSFSLPSRPSLDINRPTTQDLVKHHSDLSGSSEDIKKIEPEILEKRKQLLKSFLNPGIDTDEIGMRNYSRETIDIDEKAIVEDIYHPEKRTFRPVSASKIIRGSEELTIRTDEFADSNNEKLMEFDDKSPKEFKASVSDSPEDIDNLLKQIYLSPKRKEPLKVDFRLGEYELIEEITPGTMSKVYKARFANKPDPVAVKVPYKNIQDDYFTSHFFDNIDKARELEHPNIVKIHNAGKDENTVYMVMEYVDSMTLREIIKLSEKSNTGVIWSINLMLKICEGLNYLHSRSIVHKDIKPESIMVSPVGDIKIADHIILNSISRTGPTEDGLFIGNPYYTPPEILSESSIDERVDIYSLGVLFYELVTGFVPFSGDDPSIIMKKHMEETPIAPRKIVHAIPEEIEKIILKMIAKSPRERFSSVRVVSALLSGYLTMRAADRSYLKPKPINYERD